MASSLNPLGSGRCESSAAENSASSSFVGRWPMSSRKQTSSKPKRPSDWKPRTMSRISMPR